MGSSRFIFLDRDGTLVHDPGYVHRVEDYALLPGALEALGLLRDADYRFAIVTNQSGIGRGLYTVEQFHLFQARLLADLTAEGIIIEETYLCPHLPADGCTCRKPSPEPLFRARDRFGIDLAASWVIGDHVSDLELGGRAGARSVLLLTGHGEEECRKLPPGSTYPVVDDILAAARLILQRPRHG